MIKLVTGVFFLWVSLLCSQAQATHIQYVSLADVNNVSLGEGDIWTKTFDLVTDSMYLWEIPTHYSSSNATPTPGTEDSMGSYDLTDALHYITLRIDPNNYIPKGTSSNTYLKLEVNGNEIEDWSNPISLYEWGVPNDPISDSYGLAAVDYKFDVTLTGLSSLGSGTIAVTNVNLEGCFDTATPIPEPATMLLFGTGLVGLAGSRLRKKKK